MKSNYRIVVIDSSLPDLEALCASIDPAAEIRLIDKDADGSQALAQALQDGARVVDVVAHGEPGRVHLGYGEIQAASFAALPSPPPGGTVNLYACRAGAGEKGRHLLSALALWSRGGAAASRRVVGQSATGPNWQLEINAGAVHSAPMFQQAPHWPHQLPTYNFGDGIDIEAGSNDADYMSGGGGDDQLSGLGGSDTIDGGSGNDIILGDAGEDTLYGGLGNDELGGGTGDDSLKGGDGRDTLIGDAGFDTLWGGSGEDTLWGSAGDDVLYGEADNDLFMVGGANNGHDSFDGGTGIDVIRAAGNGTVIGIHGLTSIEGIDGNNCTGVEIEVFGNADLSLTTITDVERIRGWTSSDTIVATNGEDTVSGGGGDDTIEAGDGNDVIEFASNADGYDEVDGGAGNDRIVALTDNAVIGLKSFTNIETITADGHSNVVIQGSKDDNAFNFTNVTVTDIFTIDGGNGDDTFSGVFDKFDTIIGGDGDDTVVINGNSTDFSWDPTAGRQSWTLTESATGRMVTLVGIDKLEFSDGPERLNAGPGAISDLVPDANAISEDAPTGTAVHYQATAIDQDATPQTITYFLKDDAGGRFQIDAVTGEVTVKDTALLDYESLAAGAKYYDIIVGASDGSMSTTKSVRINVEDGLDKPVDSDTAAANTIGEGAANGDYTGLQLSASADNRPDVTYELTDDAGGRFTVNAAGQVVVADASQLDYETSHSYTIKARAHSGDHVGAEETFTIAVTNAVETQYKYGDQGANVLDYSSLTDRVEVNGYDGDDVITGTAYDDTFIGWGGNDTMNGGGGNDTFIIGWQNDVDVINGGAGTDTILANAGDFTIALAGISGVEVIDANGHAGVAVGGTSGNNSLDFSATTLIGIVSIDGGDGNDVLRGSAGNDTLVGGLGNDTLIGGTGDDTYVVDASGDVVSEVAGAGIDSVRTDLAAYTLGANVENLVYIGADDFVGTGNALNNVLVGGRGNDTLVGGAGGDSVDGGDGIDTVSYASATAAVNARMDGLAGTGGDANGDVITNVENVIGSNYADTLRGNSSDNTLNGGAGIDTLIGGGGNDVYLADVSGDVVSEAAGEGVDEVRTSATSYALSANVEVLTYTGTAAFTGTGSADDNTITGGAGNDTLQGGAGADLLNGGGGVDSASYAASAEAVDVNLVEGRGWTGDALGDTLVSIENVIGSANDDLLRGNSGVNVLTGGAGNDTLDGGAGNDTLIGGLGDDTYVVDSASDVVSEAASAGTDTVQTTLATYTLGSNVENLAYMGSGDFVGTGNTLNNVLTGGGGNDTLNGGTGNDTLAGGFGDDVYIVDSATDAVLEAWGDGFDTIRTSLTTYTLAENVERLQYTGSAALTATGNAVDNVLTGAGGNDTLQGMGGADTLDGGAGVDTASYAASTEAVEVDLVQGTGWSGDAWGDTLLNIENVIGSANNDVLRGNAGVNVLTGGAGNDTLDGGAGNDTLIGGLGDDTYVVDSTGDVVSEVASQGIDTVQTVLTTYTLGANVENLVYTGSSNFVGTGNALNNVLVGGTGNDTLVGGAGGDTIDGGDGIDTASYAAATAGVNARLDGVAGTGGDGNGDVITNVENVVGSAYADTLRGNAGDNTLNGGAGADSLIGGAGNDVYLVDNVGDVVVEAAGEGFDEVRASSTSYTLGANVEALTYTGTGTFTGTGNAADNIMTGGVGKDILSGGTGNDTLDGGSGSDTLAGGTGDDVYYVDATADVITEAAGEGNDLAYVSAATYTLGANVESMIYTGTVAFTGTGTALANTITGGAGDDTLAGLAGADTLIGGDGIDSASYAASTVGVNVNLVTGINTGGDAAGDVLVGIEGIVGSAYLDQLRGDAGDNIFNGNGGRDVIWGGAGNDTYIVNTGSDSIIFEYADEGIDTVKTNLTSYTIYNYVENLIYTGSAAFTGIGNGLDNVIIGGAGADTLTGGAGADTLNGGAGLDMASYDGSLSGVSVNLATGQNSGGDAQGDVLISIEKVSGSAYDDTLVGDGLGNTLLGGAGNDTLDGGAGTDTLTGGAGNDAYYVADSDVVVEVANEGTDTVYFSGTSHTLAANVENLTTVGTGAVTVIGNALANTIVGGSGDDVLRGLGGADTLIGGDGIDTASYAGSSAGIILDLRGPAGKGGDAEGDVLIGIENLIGSSYLDKIFGTDGANTLNGAGGGDWLFGWGGDDTFIVVSASDSIFEYAGGGTDTVQTGLASYTLSSVNVENLTYTGTGAFTGIGNDANNVLVGGIGNDTLNAGAGDDTLIGNAGTDTLIGGTGNDVYELSNADVVMENTNEGIDTVRTTLSSYTLGANLENLVYTGTVSITGTGNSLDNLLVGNAGADTLSGGDGNDTLNGGAGADRLIGGAGTDTYLLDRGNGADTVVNTNEAAGNDTINFGTDVATDQLWFRHVNDDLVVNILGTTDSITVSGWYTSSANHVGSFVTTGGASLAESAVENLVTAMSTFGLPPVGQIQLTADQHTALDSVIAANWH